MPSDIENHLRVVQVAMDALGLTVEEAIARVPADLRLQVRVLFEERRPGDVARPAILSADQGQPDWYGSIDPDSMYHWPRLRRWLVDVKGRHPDAVRNLELESSKVMRLLGDPRPPPHGVANFRVQGLVVGYVQSGKTANFTATVARAADAGYRLVIVLAGIHNTLRRQTQQRLEIELGLRPDQRGVAVAEVGRAWITLTKSDLSGDFRGGTTSGAILQSHQPLLAVVKKNGAVLRRLLQWIGEAPPPDMPVLIIDDEADQASVNTGGNQAADSVDDDDRPSTINRLVRDLLRRFRRVSYVAYTATPFANVFIDHEGMDREVLQDLYPRDFIVALDKPHAYIGAEDLFGRPAIRDEQAIPPLDLITEVEEGDVVHVVPPPRRRGDAERDQDEFRATLPGSLKDALHDFVLASAAFLGRKPLAERPATPLTMLVHSHHQIAVHQDLGAEVTTFVDDLRREWRYDRQTRLLPLLRGRWAEFERHTREIDPTKAASFDEIEPRIGDVFQELRVLTINSESDDALDYEREPGLKAVVIGGNRLSRGLTLENLLVSYFVRQSAVLDTLLQMGRWFGHRREYVDLTRLYTTATLRDWFQEVAAAEEELRDDIRIYAVTGRTPMDFGPRVRRHPILTPTARNKMQHAQVASTSFAGQLKQTIVFRFGDRDWLDRNLQATRALVSRLGSPPSAELLWRGIAVERVLAFLGTYQTDRRAGSVDADEIRRYIDAQVRERQLLIWDVFVRENEEGSSELGTEDLGISSGRVVNRINRSRLAGTDSIGILANPAVRGTDGGDESVGMSPEQIDFAGRLVARDPRLKWGRALRRARDRERGLLVIYPISPLSTPRPTRETTRQRREPLFPSDLAATMPTVVGITMVFPDSDSAATTEYLVGTAGTADAS